MEPGTGLTETGLSNEPKLEENKLNEAEVGADQPRAGAGDKLEAGQLVKDDSIKPESTDSSLVKVDYSEDPAKGARPGLEEQFVDEQPVDNSVK